MNATKIFVDDLGHYVELFQQETKWVPANATLFQFMDWVIGKNIKENPNYDFNKRRKYL